MMLSLTVPRLFNLFRTTVAMRLARIQADSDCIPLGLEKLAAAGDLDLLEIDYQRPRMSAASVVGPPELPEFAPGFAPALRAVANTLFLEPKLRVAASAGWSSSYACAELAARTLADAGCGNLPVAAVRGSNLLPILGDLASAGVDLSNVETGAPWKQLRQPVLAADLRLGAGPLIAALAEGARVVVAGCYDPTAPATGAAVHKRNWSWKQWDNLAMAAVAARVAAWSPWPASSLLTGEDELHSLFAQPQVELQDGAVTVDLVRPCQQGDADELLRWLRAGFSPVLEHHRCEVRVNVDAALVTVTAPHQLTISGFKGAAGDQNWRLEILYQTGFVAEAMLEFAPGASAAVRSRVADAFSAHFLDPDDGASTIAAQELTSDGGAASGGWLHLVCRSKAQRVCREFVDQLTAFAAANRHVLWLTGGRPVVKVACDAWPARIPRNIVDVAIDTRPAREWE